MVSQNSVLKSHSLKKRETFLYCFDLIAYCNPALIRTSTTFSPVSADNGSVNLYMYVCIYCHFSKLNEILTL